MNNHAGNDEQIAAKEEDEEVIDDEDMVEGEGEGTAQPQTAVQSCHQFVLV